MNPSLSRKLFKAPLADLLSLAHQLRQLRLQGVHQRLADHQLLVGVGELTLELIHHICGNFNKLKNTAIISNFIS